jgi:DNA-binding MarR family transcriptional regulator
VPKSKRETRRGEFVFPPEDSIGFLVRDTHRAFSRALGMAIADAGVTAGMWFFLRALWEEDGLTQRELSRRIGMTEPTTVSAIDTMERRGFVTRRIDGADRRRRLVCLTEAGRALKPALLPQAYAVNQSAIATLSADEVATLRALLLRLKANLADGDGNAK